MGIKIPLTAEEEIDLGVTMSYNGHYGTSNTVSNSVTYSRKNTYPCPGKTRCFYKMIARHLDNQDIDYNARVRRTVGGKIEEWNESGVWKGVKSYDVWAQYCTEDLITHESNCPDAVKLAPIKALLTENPNNGS